MKHHRNKGLTIALVCIGILVLGMVLWFVNAFWGNPISRMLTNHCAKQYVRTQYEDMDLQISEVGYNFKTGGYYVFVESSTSIDTHFSLEFNSLGQLQEDSYESYVLNKWNTYERIDEVYRKKVDEVLEDKTFPYKSDIMFGTIEEWNDMKDFGEKYGIKREELVVDQEYDVMELAKEAGHLILYVEDETVTIERMAKILLHIKEILENRGIAFYAVDLTLEEPRKEDVLRKDQLQISVHDFKYEEIYKEKLTERLSQAANQLEAYYEEQDKIKAQEVQLYEVDYAK